MPEEDKKIVERLIAKIRKRLSARVTQPDIKKTSFRDDPFFGIWADREDMKEGGAAWVRKFRKEQWDRSDRWS